MVCLVAWDLLWILDWITSYLYLDASESNNSNQKLQPSKTGGLKSQSIPTCWAPWPTTVDQWFRAVA